VNIENKRANEIICNLVDNYIEKEKNYINTNTDLKFKEVINQLRGLVETSLNYEEIKSIQDSLVLLEEEITDLDLKEQIKSVVAIAKSIETLDLSGEDVTNFDFSGFVGLEILNLSDSEGLSVTKFNSIPEEVKASIETLNLCGMDTKKTDLSGFTSLKTLDLRRTYNFIVNKLSVVRGYNFDFSGFTRLKTLDLRNSRGLTSDALNTIPLESKASIEDLGLRDVGVSDFDFSEFTSLKILNLNNAQGLTAEQFNGISSEAKDSIESLGLSGVNVTGFDFSGFRTLKTLDLNNVRGLTTEQFNGISSEAKDSIESLKLSGVNVTGFDFSEFTNLKILNLNNAQNLTYLPENIGEFTSLRTLMLLNNRNLTSLPTSIRDLSSSCRVDISGCGISETVREHLRETVNTEGYQGPFFTFSMEHLNPQNNDTGTIEEVLTSLYALAKQEQPSLENLPEDKEKLKVWLSRLSYMADYNVGGKRQEKLAKSIIGYLEKANEDPDFRETFFSVINGAADTCGDRMALSIVNLSIAHQVQTNDLSDMKSLAYLLSRGVWAMNTLENIAREKVKSLPFVDEIEVYLGYPTMLKESLELPINIGEMLYFRCSGITRRDLKMAEEIVKDQLNNKESLNEFLVEHDKWIEGLKKNLPEEMKVLEDAKEQAMDEENPNYENIESSYKRSLRELTTKLLT
jgi:hypothetical protein